MRCVRPATGVCHMTATDAKARANARVQAQSAARAWLTEKRIDRPEPGHYVTRRGHDAPWRPVRIWWDTSIEDRPRILMAQLCCTEVDPFRHLALLRGAAGSRARLALHDADRSADPQAVRA